MVIQLTEEQIFEVTLPDGTSVEVPAANAAAASAAAKKYMMKQGISAAQQPRKQEVSPLFDPLPERAARYASDVVNKVAGGGMMFGFGDEVSAGLDAPFVAGYRSLVEDQPFDLGRAYRDRRDTYRAEDARFTRDNPVTSVVAETTGGILSPINKVPGMKQLLSTTGGLPARTAKGVAAGGVYGSLYGAGHAEGDLADRLYSAAESGAWGAAIGSLPAPVIDGIKYIGKKGLQRVLDNKGMLSQAQRKVRDVIRDTLGGGNFEQGIAALRHSLSELGADAAIVDATGTQGARLTRGASHVMDEEAGTFILQRVQGRGRRLHEAADVLNDEDYHEIIEALNTQQRAAARPLYEEAFNPPPGVPGAPSVSMWTPRLQEFLDDPIVRKGLAKGAVIQRLEALADGVPFDLNDLAIKSLDPETGHIVFGSTPNLRMLDAAKRGIDDIINGAKDDFGNVKWTEYLRAVDRVRKALIQALDDVSTDPVTGRSAYAEARAVWAGPAQLKDAAALGRKFLRGDEEVLGPTLERMSEAQRRTFEIGVRRELTKMINTDTQTAITKFADKKADLWMRLRRVFPEEKVQEFSDLIRKETRKRGVEDFINPAANSKTAGTTEDIRAFGGVSEAGVDMATNAALGRWAQAASIPFRWLRDRLTSPNKAEAAEVWGLMTETNPAAQREIIANLRKVWQHDEVLKLMHSPDQRFANRALLTGGAAMGYVPPQEE